jgi:hypothetical protein
MPMAKRFAEKGAAGFGTPREETFMSVTVWIAARTLNHPNAGGHFWVYLNWAEGLRVNGCDLVWLEPVPPTIPIQEVPEKVASLKNRLKPYGLADCVALCPWTDDLFSSASPAGNMDLEAIADADLLLNLTYGLPSSVVRRFRRSALLDIDPGLTQIWISKGQMRVPRHDLYFTIGETVGKPGSRFPDCGLEWQYTPPCVALDRWPMHPAPAGAPFTTVSNWYIDEWVEDADGWYRNDKRSGFLPFLARGQVNFFPIPRACSGFAIWTKRRGVWRWRRKITNIIAGWPVHWRRNTSMSGRS